MHIVNVKQKLMAIITVTFLIATVLLTVSNIPATQAQFRGTGPAGGIAGPLPAGIVPDVQIQTWGLLSARPTTVGLGQPVLVNLETQPAPGTERLHKDYTVVMTKPDGTTETKVLESYPDDGTMWYEFVPDQLGQYKLVFQFLGTYFPAGRYLDGVGPPAANLTTGGSVYTESVYFKPFTTPERIVTVQKDMVTSWPPAALPTDYWTRPVPYEKREWWPILGNWPWRGPAGGEFEIPLEVFNQYYPDTNPYQPGKDSRGNFAPWTQGPESPHVAWKRELTQAGILGGDFGVEDTNSGIFGGMGIGGDPATSGWAPIAYAGSAYQQIAKVAQTTINGTVYNAATNVWTRYDVRTGEVIWEQNSVTQIPSYIEYNIGAIPSGGGFPTHVTEVNFVYIGSGRLIKYRASTGLVNTNISIAPLSTGTYYMNGYCLSVQDLGANATNAPGGRYRLINWTTLGTTASLASRIKSNISWPISSVPNTIDYNVGIAAAVTNWQRAGIYYGINVTGIDLYKGNVLWQNTILDSEYSGSTEVADHGKIAILTLNQGFIALDLRTGQQAWQSEPMDYPWDAAGFGGYSVQSAYGLLYRQAYSGIYAFDWDNGKIAWKYEAPADYPYETPYINEAGEAMYSWNIGANIADGKMYAYNTEHSATVPITRGWKFHCINATTGEKIWTVAIPGGASKHVPDVGPIHDGYVQLFSSDGYMYWFGKGKTATTVTAPDVSVPIGTALTIKGTVLDLSPAQPNTPAVSVDSMSAMMEHVHIQRDLPDNVTGVPVTLTAVGSDGSVTSIGSTMTNGYYGTFNVAWTPTKQDTYQIIASFAGDASYGSSSAATGVTVGPAPAQQEQVEPAAPTDLTPVYYGIVGAVVAIILAIAVATILIVRKRA